MFPLGVLWCDACKQHIKHVLFSDDDLCHSSLSFTLLRPELSCGGSDLEAAVTRALEVARFPVETSHKYDFIISKAQDGVEGRDCCRGNSRARTRRKHSEVLLLFHA